MNTKICLLLALCSLSIFSSLSHGSRLPTAAAASTADFSGGNPPWAPPEWFYNFFPPQIAKMIREQVRAMTDWMRQFQPPYGGGSYPQPQPQPKPQPQPQPPPVHQQPTTPPTPKVQPPVKQQPTAPPTPKVQPPVKQQPISPPTPKVQPPVKQQPISAPTPKVQPPAKQQPTTPPAPKVPQPPPVQEQPVSPPAGKCSYVTKVFDTCGHKQGAKSVNYEYAWSCTYNDKCCNAALTVSEECMNHNPMIRTIKHICCPGA